MPKNENKQYIEKTVDFTLCVIAEFLITIKNSYSDDLFSRDFNIKFEDLIQQIHSDIGHLECDFFDNEYVVECGYNYISE